MSEEEKGKQTGQTPPSGEPWQEVGRQFQILGESIAAAVRASVNNPQHQQRLKEMQGGLEKMVKDVDKAITDAASSPEAHQARSEAARAAESLRTATEQTVQEMRPRLVDALKQVNEELQRFVNRMEHTGTAEHGPDSTQSTPPAGDSKREP